eukprot:Lankesteria_metandrocarpae@DN2631_c0_g1_i1.p1
MSVVAGVLHVTALPRFMQYTKFRQFFEEFGELGRIFMKQEERDITKRRFKRGGIDKKNYIEAYVEFVDGKQAAKAANALNGTTAEGRGMRRDWSSDIWMMKHLSGVQWHDITQQHVEDNAVLTNKMRTKHAQLKKIHHFYSDRLSEKKQRDRRRIGTPSSSAAAATGNTS